jgi:hypothetical protein
MVMESLSLLLKTSQSQGLISGIKVVRLTKILHILFVDDILLLTKASIEEWKEIERIIQLFCKVSGLRVNMTKSTIHFSGMVESELSDFKHTLPYKFSDLLVGFKYLGYYLKSRIQKTNDWRWILSKFEKKIHQWSYRWLSLGGRYILCKYVFETYLLAIFGKLYLYLFFIN